ncbi:MAG: helix-turn-helix transcriptional regulator [Oscillospiraceae bacterium]|nr:helix-turn-helix transcriptional regulator [Oscillospiraceae bacterium]
MELNERLAQLRKEHGLSQNDLAEKLNVSRQAISRWEQGLAMPSSDNLIYLSRLYGSTLDELIHGKGPVETEQETPGLEDRVHTFGTWREWLRQKGRRSGLVLLIAAAWAAVLVLLAGLRTEKDYVTQLDEWQSGSLDPSSAERFLVD